MRNLRAEVAYVVPLTRERTRYIAARYKLKAPRKPQRHTYVNSTMSNASLVRMLAGADAVNRNRQGKYSTTFLLPDASTTALRASMSAARFPFRSFWQVTSGPVFVKIAGIQEGLREIGALRRLATNSKQACGRKMRAEQIVPRLYAYSIAGKKVVMFMEHVKGILIDEALKRYPSLAPQILAAFEASVRAMWNAGIVHADLHGGNVIVQFARKSTALVVRRVVLIDFGFAVAFPAKALRACVMRSIDDDPDVYDRVMLAQNEFDRAVFHPDSVVWE